MRKVFTTPLYSFIGKIIWVLILLLLTSSLLKIYYFSDRGMDFWNSSVLLEIFFICLVIINVFLYPHQRIVVTDKTIEIYRKILFWENMVFSSELADCEFYPDPRWDGEEFNALGYDAFCKHNPTGETYRLRTKFMWKASELRRILMPQLSGSMMDIVSSAEKQSKKPRKSKI